MENNDIDKLIELLGEDEKKPQPKKPGIDIMGLLKVLWTKRRYFYITIPLSIIIAVVYSKSLTPFYVVRVKLAPELSNTVGSNGGALSSIMKSLGRGVTSNQEGDAILPNLYPDLMNSQLFLVSLFDIPVESRDGSIKTTYFDYLNKYQKHPWWSGAVNAIKSLIPSFGDDDEPAQVANNSKKNAKDKQKVLVPTALNSNQEGIAKAIAGKVKCDVDKKTYVITITVTDQDPIICATVADSACNRLQAFITDYRTKKARIEYEHLLAETEKAHAEYEEAKEEVGNFNDANWDLVDADFLLEKQALQNELQLKFSVYSTINSQLVLARAKVDEARPAFTVLDGANVPLKPEGPKKKNIVVAIVFVICFLQALWLMFKEFRRQKKAMKETEEVKANA